MSTTLKYALLICSFFAGGLPTAQLVADPNFQYVFDQYIPGPGSSHTDIHKIIVGKPITRLNLSLNSSGNPLTGGQHLAGSEILLDLSNAFIVSQVNNDQELSVDAIFFTEPLAPGEYLATKLVLGYDLNHLHDTFGTVSGSFSDGQTFELFTDFSLIPEPTSLILSITGVSLLLLKRVRY